MEKQPINIVWLKRDLRTQDHAPLYEAEQSGLPYLSVFLFEPSIYQYTDTSLRHLQFQYHSINAINETLAAYQKKVMVCHAEAIDVFRHLATNYSIQSVFSYRESGISLTYERDTYPSKKRNIR